MTVDIAVLKDSDTQVLLGKKATPHYNGSVSRWLCRPNR